VKKKVTILGFIFLALILAAMPFMAACGEEEPAPTTPTTPTTPTMGEPVYTVMDPRGTEPPREYSGINPRLDTLSGKKVIVVNLHGGNEDAIRSVAPELEAAIPDCQVSLLECEARWAVNAAEWEQIEANDAAIFGHDY